MRDEVQGARSAGTEAYINMLRLRAPRNAAIRPHRQLISVSLEKTLINSFKTLKPHIFVFLKILQFLIPIILFYIFNMLTPFWWDDFVMSCNFVEWYAPRTELLSSFSDIIVSTENMYHSWHGRVATNFFNFLFMYFKDKTIFNVFNTAVYCIFNFLICFHVAGSLKKISGLLFILTNISLWLLISAWGQTFLWLTGSFNYLWTSTIILFFLIPFRKKIENASYRPHIISSVLWLLIGVMAGWSMENSASGILVLLLAYFIFLIYRKEAIAVFEISGSAGFVFGFFMLIRARNEIFSDFVDLMLNALEVGFTFIINDMFVLGLIILLALELLIFRKKRIGKPVYGYFIAAFGSLVAMVLPGFYGGRAIFIVQLFLIITMLSLIVQLKGEIVTRRYIVITGAVILLLFLPSFYKGGESIVYSYLYAEARERYILTEKQKGNMEISVKTPIPINNSHSGLYDAIDVLPYDPSNVEYITHNSAKAVWYGIKSLDGIPTDANTSLFPSIEKYFWTRKRDGLNFDDLYKIVYENW